MKIRVNPTRMQLLRLKKRLVMARRGHKLLKDKLEGLVQAFMDMVNEYAKLRDEIDTGAKFGLAAGTARTLTTRQGEKLTVSGAGRFASSTGKDLLQNRQQKMEMRIRQNKHKERRNFQIATA